MLCSKHFEEDCFEKEVVIAASLGISRRRKLKPSAVPSIFKKRFIKPDTISGQAVKCCNTDSDDHFPAKKPRATYEKRERARASKLFLSLFFFFFWYSNILFLQHRYCKKCLSQSYLHRPLLLILNPLARP